MGLLGALAKMITPQDEKGGWISSIVIGIIGSFVGHFLGGFSVFKAPTLLAGY